MLEQKQRDENLARAMMDQDKRVIFRRNNRVARDLEREQKELQDMIRTKQEKEAQLLAAQREHEEEELFEKQRSEALRQKKLKQLAREHHEVRALRSQLQELLTKKQQYIQIEQHSIDKELSLLEKDKLKHQIDQKVLEYERQVKIEELKVKEQQQWYKDSLDCQMTEIDERQEQMFQEFLKEKKLIDDLLVTIQNEDQLTFKQKIQEKLQVQNYIREFLQDRDEFRRNEYKRTLEEDEKIKNYILLKDSKLAADHNKKNALDEVREKIYEQLAANIKIRERERLDQEELSYSTAQHDIEEKEKFVIQNELQKRINDRIVLLDSYKQHLIQKKNSFKTENDSKLKEREELVEQLKEDKRLESLTAAAKKRRMLQYHHELSQLVEFKHKLAKETEINEKNLIQKIHNIENEKQQILNNEKAQIIAEYALRLKVPESQLRTLLEK